MKRKLKLRSDERTRLERNLENLSCYCHPGRMPKDDLATDGEAWRLSDMAGSYQFGCWPSRALLTAIERDVLILAERKRAIFPVWKAFEQVDKRLKGLRLKSRVNDLISRARKLLPGRSELSKLVRLAIAGKAQDQCAYRDMVLDPQKLAELLRVHEQVMIRRDRAQPLVYWTLDIEHPFAKDWGYIEKLRPTVEEVKAWQRSEGKRKRARRHRSGKKFAAKNVTRI
jgi:hypothetical protein